MSDCLDCPDEQNYAAIALQLQETALQTEQCIEPLAQALRAAANRPAYIEQTFVANNIAANVVTVIPTTAASEIFVNSNFNSFNGFTLDLPGVYQVGVRLQALPSGAVDNNSFRQLRIRVRNVSDPASMEDRFTALLTTHEPNNGLGVDMSLSTTVVVEENDVVSFTFLHNNTSSSIDLIDNAYWGVKLSDRNTLRVV